jgi:HAD superfamily hydrolase (TIGR01509 family)
VIELVIFDCDGVLVDSERIAVEVDVELLAGLGWPLSAEEIVERFMGRSTEYMSAEIRARVGDSLPDDWEAQFERRYREALEAQLKPVDGIPEVLDEIEVPTCVASSGSHEKMRFTLGLTGLYERFDGRIFSALEVAEGKPAPDLFLHAAERMRASPAGCAVIEDSVYGVQAARAAGMRALAYGGGLTAPDRLAAEGATVFGHMQELPGLLAELG